jgi:transposase
MTLHRPTQAELDRMSHAEKDALIMTLFDGFGDLQRRVEELEGQRKKTSRNSSKPPSSDGLKKGPAQPRKRGEKPNGGQPGHPGQTRRMAEQANTVVDLKPHGHCACGQALADLPGTLKERRQQWDIPPPQILITEYRQHQVECPCGQVHCGEFPAGITPNVSFGPRIKAYAVGLIDGHFVGLQRTAEILQDQYGVRPSEGSLQRWIAQASERLMEAYTAAGNSIQAAEVGHFDESGMRVAGKLRWLHVAASETAVHYSTHEKRGQEAMEAAGILPNFKGCAVHDHWKPYLAYEGVSHALCNAHHLRELRYFEERTGHWWPIALRRLLVEGKEAVAAAQAEGRDAVDPTQVETLLKRYDEHLAWGLAAFPVVPPDPHDKRRRKQHPATNLLVRLRDFKSEVWRFLTDWRVPFDNNAAERLVRPVKVKLKVSGGLRAVGGAEAFCVLRSVWETSKLNGQNPFEVLRQALTA